MQALECSFHKYSWCIKLYFCADRYLNVHFSCMDIYCSQFPLTAAGDVFPWIGTCRQRRPRSAGPSIGAGWTALKGARNSAGVCRGEVCWSCTRPTGRAVAGSVRRGGIQEMGKEGGGPALGLCSAQQPYLAGSSCC